MRAGPFGRPGRPRKGDLHEPLHGPQGSAEAVFECPHGHQGKGHDLD